MTQVRYFLKLSYKGTHYHGWQRQPNAITVQQTLEEALATILRIHIPITGAGRTDTGVHASEMYAHFEVETAFAKADKKKLLQKLNGLLPKDIAIQAILPVTPEAHTRFDAIQRSYLYRISKSKNPFTTESAYHFKKSLNIPAMNIAAARLLQHTNFECFSKSHTDVKTYLCDVRKAIWTETEEEYRFEVSADRFLRNMVRAIVGTLLEIGLEKHPPEWIDEVIQSKSRAVAGVSVPAHGLYLTEVSYPKTIFKD